MQRPRVGESDEDIIKQQEEFLKSKNKDKCVSFGSSSKRKNHDNEGPSYLVDAEDSAKKKSKSRFAKERSIPERSALAGTRVPVLGDIVEKNYPNDVISGLPTHDASEGFPRARKRDGDAATYKSGKSIFSQELQHHNANKRPPDSSQDLDETLISSATQGGHVNVFGSGSYVVSGPASAQIHEENVRLLAAMPPDEVKAEQLRLKSLLDPKVVEFLRARREMRGGDIHEAGKDFVNEEMEVDLKDQSSSQQSASSSTDAAMSESFPSISLPFSPDEMENFVHMNMVEEDKLQWTTDLPTSKPHPANAPYSARFDFQGMLLPYEDESISVTSALHHHGDEPGRPGYTLQELFILGRSTVLQQRVLALVTIANIITKTKLGYYDGCFTPPLLHQLADMNIFLLVRFSLDDSNIAVVTAALNAMRSLVNNKSDEMWLDALIGFKGGLQQPSLFVEPAARDPNETKEMKDHQIVEEDMIKGALRTDLLPRLRYILETLQPGASAVVASLEILTRIARHSYDAALEIMRLPNLVNIIVKHFVTKHWEKLVAASTSSKQTSLYGLPVVQALKLFRIIACRSRQLASDMVHIYGVMDFLVIYITLTQQMELRVRDQVLLQLNRESFYLWQTFLSYNLASDHFSKLQPVLMGLLRFHWEQTDIRVTTCPLNHEHCAALLAVIERALLLAESQAKRISQLLGIQSLSSIPNTVTVEDIRPYIPMLEDCLRKWLVQLGSIDTLSFTVSMMKMISAAMSCLASYYRVFTDLPNRHLIGFLEDMLEMNAILNTNLFANGFFKNNITVYMIRSSNLLRLRQQHEETRDPPSLPSVQSLGVGGDLAPVIRINSPIMFLLGISNFLVALHTVHKGLDKQCLQRFLDDETLSSYVKYVNNRRDLQLRNNWFTRYETHFLVNVVRLAHIFEPRASVRNLLFYDLAVRLVTLVQEKDRHLLRDIMKNVVFNSDFIIDSTSLIAELKGLKIDEDPERRPSKNNLLACSVNNLPSIWVCYERALGLNAPPDNPLDRISLTVDSLGAAVPSDWVYLPLLGLCNQQSSAQSTSAEDTEMVVCCLSWVLIAECLKESLISEVDVTSRYCRVATVFLSSCDLFLEPRIKTYLEEFLNALTKEENLSRLELTKSIPGLTSFYDLYSQLLQQFAAVSYGSVVFGQFIMIPLRQKEDISFRRQLWFEHAACIRVLGLPVDALPFPMDDMLWPLEKDPAQITQYFKYLVNKLLRPTWSPVLYTVALHHVAFFLEVEHDDEQLVKIQTRMKQSLRLPQSNELLTALQGHITELYLAKGPNLVK